MSSSKILKSCSDSLYKSVLSYSKKQVKMYVANKKTFKVEIKYNGTSDQQSKLLPILEGMTGQYQWSDDYGLIRYTTFTMHPEIEIRKKSGELKLFFTIDRAAAKSYPTAGTLVKDFGEKIARESYDIFFDSVETNKWDYDSDWILKLTNSGVYPGPKQSNRNVLKL